MVLWCFGLSKPPARPPDGGIRCGECGGRRVSIFVSTFINGHLVLSTCAECYKRTPDVVQDQGAYLESIVGEVGNCQGLHIGCSIGQAEDDNACHQVGGQTAFAGHSMPSSPYAQVCNGMIEQEVCVCHEVQADGHLCSGHRSASSVTWIPPKKLCAAWTEHPTFCTFSGA